MISSSIDFILRFLSIRTLYECLLFAFFLSSINFYGLEETAPKDLHVEEVRFCGEARVHFIKSWDKLLTWTLKTKIKPYALEMPLVQKFYTTQDDFLVRFEKEYGFYSSSCPLVGVVTEDKQHVALTNEVLRSLSVISNKDLRTFSQDEVLAKVMAYRNLEKREKITMTDQNYIVDEIMDLWRGMPAFGLVPEHKGASPILLFRGTDMNLISKKGWASVLSDLDTTGPGHATFLKARESIRKWLEKAKRDYGPARVVGYSLGGSFVFYTIIYDADLLNRDIPSVAFNPPGVSKEIYEKWNGKKSAKEIPLIAYVNQGDIVSQIGLFLPRIWEITLGEKMYIIQSHTILISGQTAFTMNMVNVEKENHTREYTHSDSRVGF